MIQTRIADIKDCREFALTLRAKPPLLLHGSLSILTLLLTCALVWAWWTEADLVVQVDGRVRPISPPKQVVCTVRESRHGGASLRVVRVEHQVGARVRQGDVLVQLDTELIDNEIARHQRQVQACEEELASLLVQKQLSEQQSQAEKLKLQSQYDQAIAEANLEKERRATDLRLAKAELELTNLELERRRKLLQSKAVSEEEFNQRKSEHAIARAKLEKASLPVDDSKAKVARQAISAWDMESELRREQLSSRIHLKRSEIEAARLEIENLQLEQRQACLVAPIDGFVSSGEIRIGDVLESNKAVLEISEQNGFYFEARVPSSEMAFVKVGMPARVQLDAYDYQRYGTLSGHVVFVAADSTINNDPSRAFYLVRIQLDQEKLGGRELVVPVKLGLTGRVEIIVDSQSLLSIFLKKIRQNISLG